MNYNEALLSVEQKFATYQEMLTGIAAGSVQHLVVRGSPGIGKTFEAERVLRRDRSRRVRLCRQAGHMTPLALYNHLYNHRAAGEISLFDDCDDVFRSEHAMNLLKAATDTRTNRRIAWGSTTKLAAAREYAFHGQVMILTNVDMRANERFRPLLDRVLYFDMAMTSEEIVARIAMILAEANADHPKVYDVQTWMIANYTRFGPWLSLRTGIKALELARMSPNWQELAEATLLPRV